MNYGFILKSGKIISNTATHRQISNLYHVCLQTHVLLKKLVICHA